MEEKQDTRLAKPGGGQHVDLHDKNHLAPVDGIPDFGRGHFLERAWREVVAVIRGHLVDSDHDGGEGELLVAAFFSIAHIRLGHTERAEDVR